MATGAIRVVPVARTARGKSAAFQRSLEGLRNGRSYQEFVNAIKAKTGLAFSRSYLKRVEDGSLGPNPLLLCALELLDGREPSQLLMEYAIEAAGVDLIRRDPVHPKAPAGAAASVGVRPSAHREADAAHLHSSSISGKRMLQTPKAGPIGGADSEVSRARIAGALGVFRSATDRLNDLANTFAEEIAGVVEQDPKKTRTDRDAPGRSSGRRRAARR